MLSDEVGVAILELPAIEDIAGGTIHQAAHARRAARQHFMTTRPGSGLEDKRLSHGQEEEEHPMGMRASQEEEEQGTHLHAGFLFPL